MPPSWHANSVSCNLCQPESAHHDEAEEPACRSQPHERIITDYGGKPSLQSTPKWPVPDCAEREIAKCVPMGTQQKNSPRNVTLAPEAGLDPSRKRLCILIREPLTYNAHTMHIRHLGYGFSLLLMGLLFGCERGPASDAEGLAKVTSALQVQVSPPFDVEPYPTVFDMTSPGRAKLACGTSHCLMIYNLALPDNINRVFATRFDANGTRLDEPSLQISKNEYILGVGARGDEFLVVTSQYNNYTTSSIGTVHYYRVGGSDGAVLEDATSRMPTATPYRIALTGSTWMIVYPGVSYYASLALYDASLQPVGTPVPFQALATTLEVVPGPGQYFAVGYGLYQRIDESTGAPIESAPVKYTQYLSPADERAAYLNGVYEIVCGSGIQLYGWRVNATTGALLDPDDTFNGKTGGKVLRDVSATVTNVPQGIEVDAFDNSVIVSYFSSYWEVNAMRVDITTGLPASTTTDSFGSVPGSITTGGTFQFNVLGQSAFLMDNDQYIKNGTTEASPNIANFPGSWLTAAVPAYLRWLPQVASNGSNYVVVFTVGSTSPQVYATRIDPNTGAYLDNPPVLIGAGYYPSVVLTGSGYLISWINPNGTGGTYGYSIQFPLPTQANTNQYAISSSNISVTPQFAYNGDYLLSTWGNLAARMTATGGVLSADGLAAGASPYYSLGFWHSSSVSGPWPAVVGDTTPTSAYRTFLVVGNTGTLTSPTVSAVRIRSATGAMQATTTVATGHENPFAATDGTNFLVVSNAYGTRNWDGVFVDSLSGLPVGTPVPMAALTSSQTVTGLFFDGTNYNLIISDVYADLTVDSLYLRRFDTSLNRLAEEGTGMGTLLSGSYPFRWTSGAANMSNGRSMVVFDAIDPARAGAAIKGVFVASDGSTPTLGTGGASGSAGASSTTSLGGASSNPSTSSTGGLTANGGAGGFNSTSSSSGGASAVAGGASTSSTGGLTANGGAGGFNSTSSSSGGASAVAGGASATGSGTTSAGAVGGASTVSSGGQGALAVGGSTSSTSEAGGASSSIGGSPAGASANTSATQPASSDAGTGDAGDSSTAYHRSAPGCGCRVGAAKPSTQQLGWLLGLGVVLARRKRTARTPRRATS